MVKSLLLTPERSYERKIQEVILSLRLEQQLTKDEILYLYLNQIYLGDGAYGIAAAAQVYFSKDVEDLTLPEAAVLAGLPQAPSRYLADPSREACTRAASSTFSLAWRRTATSRASNTTTPHAFPSTSWSDSGARHTPTRPTTSSTCAACSRTATAIVGPTSSA